jgi:ATP-dependent 26S proteasome regulatory subunit
MSSTDNAKLLYLVKKILFSSNSSTAEDDGRPRPPPPNVDYVLTLLRSQHKEYLRKDMQVLKRQVQQVMQQLTVGTDVNHMETTAMSRDRKRKSREFPLDQEHNINDEDDDHHHNNAYNSDDEEAAYDQAVAEQEAIREAAIANLDVDNSGGLNASLRERYKQVQLERETQELAAAAANAVVESSSSTTLSSKKPISKVATPKKRKNTLKQQRTNNAASNALSDNPDFINPVARPEERYSDLGGMDAIITQLQQLVEYPMIRPELYNHLGIDPPRGVLLRGPPGTGKSHLANAGMYHIML